MAGTTRKKSQQEREMAEMEKQLAKAREENEALVLENQRAEKRMTLNNSNNKKKKAKKSREMDAMEKEVFSVAKTELSQYKKFIVDDKMLCKCTRWVMIQLDLSSMKGLEGTDLLNKEEEWIAANKDVVRRGMNSYRNYTQQEMREYFLKFFADNQEELLPEKDEMLQFALRAGLRVQKEDADGNFSGPGSEPSDVELVHRLDKFEYYADGWVGKAAGQEHWARPTLKYYFRISEKVTASTEAFLVVMYENCYDKWTAQAKLIREGNFDTVAFTKAERLREKTRGQQPLYPTPYTTASSGQCMFGGFNKAGMKRYKEVKKLIEEARTQDWVEEVEDQCLQHLRLKYKRDEIDTKAKRPRARAVEEEEESDFSDCDDLEV
jgi:hypothetical protein